jgi:hypothetical protein
MGRGKEMRGRGRGEGEGEGGGWEGAGREGFPSILRRYPPDLLLSLVRF